MLDAKPEIKTAIVRKCELAPQLSVTLGCGHAGLIPDVGEVSEFHSRFLV
jgi:hypothetical protein